MLNSLYLHQTRKTDRRKTERDSKINREKERERERERERESASERER